MNPNTPNLDGQWLPCEDGKLKRLSEFVRERQALQDRRSFLRNSSIVVVAAVGAGLGYSLLGGKSSTVAPPSGVGPIACSEVLLRLAEYVEGTLDRPTKVRIQEHLGNCNPCKRQWYVLQGMDPDKYLPKASGSNNGC